MENEARNEAGDGPPSAVPCFSVGDRVRVRVDTADPDYPDIPLGGWVGMVRDIASTETGPLYLVAWNEETLTAAPPVYRRRCDRDDLEFEQSWLPELALETDPGGPVAIQQPAKLIPGPLNLENSADRARHILGLSSDDELPPVEAKYLRRFHVYLLRSGKFPFPAGLDLGGVASGPGLQPVMVRRLLPEKYCLEVNALMVEVARAEDQVQVPLELLEPLPGPAISADLEAYRAWLEYNRADDEDEPGWLAAHPFLRLGMAVALLTGLMGILLEALPETHLPAAVVACLVGVLGGLLGARYGALFWAINRLPPNLVGGLVVGSLVGLVAGASLGGALGALLGTYLGSIPGAMAGTMLGSVLAWLRVRGPGKLFLTFLGAGAGAAVVAFATDADLALSGLWHGLAAGAVTGLAVMLAAWAWVRMLLREHD